MYIWDLPGGKQIVLRGRLGSAVRVRHEDVYLFRHRHRTRGNTTTGHRAMGGRCPRTLLRCGMVWQCTGGFAVGEPGVPRVRGRVDGLIRLQVLNCVVGPTCIFGTGVHTIGASHGQWRCCF